MGICHHKQYEQYQSHEKAELEKELLKFCQEGKINEFKNVLRKHYVLTDFFPSERLFMDVIKRGNIELVKYLYSILDRDKCTNPYKLSIHNIIIVDNEEKIKNIIEIMDVIHEKVDFGVGVNYVLEESKNQQLKDWVYKNYVNDPMKNFKDSCINGLLESVKFLRQKMGTLFDSDYKYIKEANKIFWDCCNESCDIEIIKFLTNEFKSQFGELYDSDNELFHSEVKSLADRFKENFEYNSPFPMSGLRGIIQRTFKVNKKLVSCGIQIFIIIVETYPEKFGKLQSVILALLKLARLVSVQLAVGPDSPVGGHIDPHEEARIKLLESLIMRTREYWTEEIFEECCSEIIDYLYSKELNSWETFIPTLSPVFKIFITDNYERLLTLLQNDSYLNEVSEIGLERWKQFINNFRIYFGNQQSSNSNNLI